MIVPITLSYFIVAKVNEAGLAVSFLTPITAAGSWTKNADHAEHIVDYEEAVALANDWTDYIRLKGIGQGCTVLHVKNGSTADIGLDQFDQWGLPLF